MSGESQLSKDGKDKDKVCRILVQQCVNATLRFDTDDPPVHISNGMVVFVCFLQGATVDHLDNIVKAVTNAKLCEPASSSSPDSSGRDSVLKHKLDILLISQATLGGKLKGKGMQYHGLVSKSLGEELFANFVQKIKDTLGESNSDGNVASGVYGARQILSMETNGPFSHVFEF